MLKNSLKIFVYLLASLFIAYFAAMYVFPTHEVLREPGELLNENHVRILYNNLSHEYDLPPFNEFKKSMEIRDTRLILFTNCSEDRSPNFKFKTFDEFEFYLFSRDVRINKFNNKIFLDFMLASLFSLIFYSIIVATYKFFRSKPKSKSIVAFELLWLIVSILLSIIPSIVYEAAGFILVGIFCSYFLQGIIWAVGVLKKSF